MFCEHCGTKRENGHQFCANCGSKVIETTTNVPHVSPILETSKDSSIVTEGVPKTQTGNKSKKKWRWGWIFLCYGIFASLKSNPDIINTNATNFFTALFYLAGIVLAPLLYYRFRDKFLNFIKNEGVRHFVVGFVFMIGFVFSISILGAVCNRIFLGNSEQVTQDAANLQKTISEHNIWISDWQQRWDNTQSEIVDDTDSPTQFTKNVAAYKALRELNTEKFNRMKSLIDTVSTRKKYSPSLPQLISFNGVIENALKANSDIALAQEEMLGSKAIYFQALSNKDPQTEVENDRLMVNQKVDQFIKVQKDTVVAMAAFSTAINESFK